MNVSRISSIAKYNIAVSLRYALSDVAFIL